MASFETINAPPAQLVEFVERLVRETVLARVEERREPRHKIAIEVLAQPLDPDFQPTSEPFKAMSRDISAGGLGLVHTRSISDKHLLVKLEVPSGSRMTLVMEVLRCRPMGLFYDIGGRFVARLNSEEQTARVTEH